MIKYIDMKTFLSLILPCYNEAEHLKESFPKVIAVLRKLNRAFEIIIIDDGSQDDTVKIIESLIKENKNIPIDFFRHKKNVGRGGTVVEGIKKAKGEVVGFIDIDLEITPGYIPQFAEKIHKDKTDVVVGRRYYSFSIKSFHRFIASKLYAFLIQFILYLPVHDTEAGYKFFNRKKILSVLSSVKDTRWFWDTEIVARSHMNNLRLAEIKVLFQRRYDKTSTVKFIEDTVGYIKSLIVFKKSISRK